MVFIALLTLYGLYVAASTWLSLKSEVKSSKTTQDTLKAIDISIYNQHEANLSSLALHNIWDIPEYQPPKEKIVDQNSSDENETFELRNQNGFYTIIMGKKELDFLGVAKRGEEALAIFFDALKKSNEKFVEYPQHSTIYKSVKLHRIYENYILLIDTKTYKKIKIPYFLVEKLKYDANATEIDNGVANKLDTMKKNRKRFGRRGLKKMSRKERMKFIQERMKKHRPRRNNKGNKK